MKFKNLFCIILMIFSLIVNSSAQNIINGKITTDSIKELVYLINILSLKDSTFLKGDFYVGDQFSIPIKQDDILFQLSAAGYQDTLFPIVFNKEKIKNVNITLKPKIYSLDEVVVVGRSSAIKYKNGNLNVDVNKIGLSQCGSAVDVLSKIIRVNVDENNNVSVLGRGNAVVYVNNRKIRNSDELASLSSEQIEKVEVISNPSAKYDASGRAVVRITTKTNTEIGHGAAVTFRVTKGHNWSDYYSILYTFGSLKHSLYSYYVFNPYTYYTEDNYIRDYTNLEKSSFTTNDVYKLRNYKTYHRFNISDRYKINNKSNLTVLFFAKILEGDFDTDNETLIYSDLSKTKLRSKIIGTTKSVNSKQMFIESVKYENEFRKDGIYSIGIDYMNYGSKNNDNILEVADLNSNLIRENISSNNLCVFSIDGDLEFGVGDSSKIEMGLRFVDSRTESNVELFKGNRLSYNLKSDYFEQIASGYVNFKKNWNKNRFAIGVRLEGESKKYEDISDRVEFDFFPNINYKYDFTKNLGLSLDLSKKITRPKFQDLNPSLNYIDSLSYFQGNPYLKSSIDYIADFTITYMKYASLNVNYRYTRNPTMWYVDQPNENLLITKVTQINIDKLNSFSINTVIPYRYKWATIYVAMGLIKNQNSNLDDNFKIDFYKPQYYFQSGLNLDFKNKLSFNFSYKYYSSGIEGIWFYDSSSSLDLGVQKSFLNRKLTTSIYVSDILKTNGLNTYTTINDKTYGYKYYHDKFRIKFAITYNIRSAKSKHKKAGVNSEIKRIKED